MREAPELDNQHHTQRKLKTNQTTELFKEECRGPQQHVLLLAAPVALLSSKYTPFLWSRDLGSGK